MSTDKTTPPAAGDSASQPKPAADKTAKPSSSGAAAKSAASAGEPGKRRGRGGLLFLLLVLVGASAAGYYYAAPLWQSFYSEQQALSRQVEALETALAAQQSSQQQLMASSAAQAQQLESLPLRLSAELSGQLSEQLSRKLDGPVANLVAAVQRNQLRIKDLNGDVGRQWQLAELQYSIRLASMRLAFERDVAPSVELLERADALLAEWGDPALAALRAALAADISSLQQLPSVDRHGLYNRLLALAEQAQSALQVEVAELTFNPASDRSPDSAAPADWRVRLSQLGDLLGEIFILQRSDQPLPELVAPSQQQLLAERFALALEQAALALWRADGELYRHSLALAQQLVTLAAASSDQTAPLLAELSALAAEPVAAPQLTISRSEQALYDWQRASRGEQSEQQP